MRLFEHEYKDGKVEGKYLGDFVIIEILNNYPEYKQMIGLQDNKIYFIEQATTTGEDLIFTESKVKELENLAYKKPSDESCPVCGAGKHRQFKVTNLPEIKEYYCIECKNTWEIGK